MDGPSYEAYSPIPSASDAAGETFFMSDQPTADESNASLRGSSSETVAAPTYSGGRGAGDAKMPSKSNSAEIIDFDKVERAVVRAIEKSKAGLLITTLVARLKEKYSESRVCSAVSYLLASGYLVLAPSLAASGALRSNSTSSGEISRCRRRRRGEIAKRGIR